MLRGKDRSAMLGTFEDGLDPEPRCSNCKHFQGGDQLEGAPKYRNGECIQLGLSVSDATVATCDGWTSKERAR